MKVFLIILIIGFLIRFITMEFEIRELWKEIRRLRKRVDLGAEVYDHNLELFLIYSKEYGEYPPEKRKKNIEEFRSKLVHVHSKILEEMLRSKHN